VPGLGASFGRGGATTALQDLANADCVLIQGSSMAEAHPVGFRWVMKAKERGATVIHVDPRFSRTSALADLWIPIRAGGDIALLGGLIRHVLENRLHFEEYVLHYTNASCLLTEDYADTEDLDGVFSGWDEAAKKYDKSSWRYEGEPGKPERDMSLQHPRSVFQVLRRHFARYTPEMVERVAGVPPELFTRLADALTSASGPDKTAAICYAVGWTHHSKGVQVIRSAAILQLLLGNVGRPGGGILALRGHASIQGSTDIPTLYNILPGYLPMPTWQDAPEDDTPEGWIGRNGKDTGWWCHSRAYLVSLLKAWYGDNAHAGNDWGYGFLPRLSGDHSHFEFFADMAAGHVEGMFLMGQNPAVGAQHARLERRAMTRLKWLVVREMVETESANFWRQGPEIERGEFTPEDVGTEVFLFPAAGHAEKEGAFTQTQRMLQWREKAVDPPGDARSDAWFVHQLAKRLIARAQDSDDPRDESLRSLDWWYPETSHGEPRMESVLAEINGWETAIPEAAGDPVVEPGLYTPEGVVHGLDREGRPHHGRQVEGFQDLAADGSTACGCWIYSGVYGPDGVNKALRREPSGPYGHGWGYAWPSDRRILYNRASARPDGEPWSDAKKLVWWDASRKRWVGDDVPDFTADKPPGYRPPPGATGMDAHAGDMPFLMHPEGLGRLYVPEELNDGPLPTHYEPLESPVRNSLYGRQSNPAADRMERPGLDNPWAASPDPRFPHVLTTYRLTEHHTAGGMSRFLPHLAELQPEMFIEVSPELAAEVGLENAGWATVVTPRGAVEARVLVTRRMRPLRVAGGRSGEAGEGETRRVHQVAMPFHWGSAGPVTGDVANDLVPLSLEPNVSIHESKALTCAVVPGRRPRGKDFQPWLDRFLAGSGETTP
jgi:formate dehydrogenase major subunit